MCDFYKTVIAFSCLWISFSRDYQVEAYFNDAINPVKVDLSVWHQRNTRVAISDSKQLTCEKPDIYICEEPPNAVHQDSGKTCNYRNVWYHEQVYRWVAGRGCLLYTPNFLYVEGVNTINLSAGCFYGNWFAPCLEIAKPDGTCGCYPFDPGFEEVAKTVRNAVVPSARNRWETCYYEASNCCSHYMTDNVNHTDSSQCGATFDGWTCWQPAEAGTSASTVCSEFAYSNAGPSCDHFSTKECYTNGTWELQTDYSTCSVTPRLLRRYRFYIAMLAFSIIACLPAVIIFLMYKRLRVTRVALHRNLLIAIIVRNILVIISRSEVYIDELTNTGETTMSVHALSCRVLAIAERVAGNAVFVCMLLEGIYLHRLIVAVFRQKIKMAWLYGIGAVISILPAVIWAVVMGIHNNHSCWVVYTMSNIQWILDGPRILILLINTCLFADVMRVLLTKIRNSENANQLNTVKATLFLMPLFGVQFIFTAIRPTTSNCVGEQTYYFFSYMIEGLQGFIVAMLFCYVNKDVHTLIKLTYKKTESAVVSRVRGSSFPRQSYEPNFDRRLTYSTGLPTKNVEDLKPQYATMKPVLHVAEIISIQASERLAEILDPVYETVENGQNNEGYGYLDRSDIDSDNRNWNDYYGFTNASSVSIACPDWIRCVSTSASSIYNISVNDLEKNEKRNAVPNLEGIKEIDKKLDDSAELDNGQDLDSNYEDCENMLDEIMQYIETNDNIGRRDTPVVLNPEELAPNRKDGDKIIFI